MMLRCNKILPSVDKKEVKKHLLKLIISVKAEYDISKMAIVSCKHY